MKKKAIRTTYRSTLDKFKVNVSFDEHWSYYKAIDNSLPTSGFKVHLSASITNATTIIERCLPYLIHKGLNFKAVSNLRIFELQNRGIFWFSQIGKLVTIYPRNDQELNTCLEELNLLTKDINSPLIPSDFNYKQSTVVHYRYGAFKQLYNKENTKMLLELSNGSILEDKRTKTIPQEVAVTIQDFEHPRFQEIPRNFLILSVLRKRGKGGVYKVFDTTDKKLKILKEGCLLGEIEESGVDGLDRLFWEKKVLEDMQELVYTPKIYDAFYVARNFFIVQEFFEGKTLEEMLYNEPSFTELTILAIVIKIAKAVETIHINYKYTIRDLSFNNILINKLYEVKLIDFEFAHKNTEEAPPYILVGSPGFYDSTFSQEKNTTDIYSIVCILYYLLKPTEYQKIQNIRADYFKKTLEEISKKNLDDIDPLFKNIIQKGLNFKYININELLNDLYIAQECVVK
ncbi:protein kinase [Bacillus mycoides]|uniref:class III lanthionine synthetase LanKC N-terminal domain-containing protein n=1 Tax=Bacillus mycoides TaxID=1405 RepID=UPI0035CC3E64